MRLVLFTHSILSCWNHGNAHFLRGVVRVLLRRGHAVRVMEPANGWSRTNLLADHGASALASVRAAFPFLDPETYGPDGPDLERALDGADAVLVHEWTDPALVARIGRARAAGGRFRLLFHDTHHRMVTQPDAMRRLDLSAYDGVLAFGEALRERYAALGWGGRAWTWHEAADVDLFRPIAHPACPDPPCEGDLVWIGNWGDGERTAELTTFLLDPVRLLGLGARVHGVRYPATALDAVRAAGATFAGWLPNHRVPEAFARFRATVHVPRRPYAAALPGIPTIRVFEALACGIPLVCAPWDDAEGLFRPGRDFLTAANGPAMGRALRDVLNDAGLARDLARNGIDTIRCRHTCARRVDELMSVLAALDARRETTKTEEEAAP